MIVDKFELDKLQTIIDYSKVNDILNKERAKSIDFLKNAFE